MAEKCFGCSKVMEDFQATHIFAGTGWYIPYCGDCCPIERFGLLCPKQHIGRLDSNLKDYIRYHFPKGFKPIPHYNEIGRFWEWYWSNEDAYSDPIQVDGVHVGSLMRSMKTNQPVGVKIYV